MNQKIMFLVIVIMCLLIIFTSVTAVSNSDNWYMFRHDQQHTGYTTSKAPAYKYLSWKVKAGEYIRSSPAIVDDWVYIGSHGGVDYTEVWGKISCFNSETGEKRWEYETDDWVFSSPAVVNNKVYCGSNDFKLYCLDATNGNLKWYYETGFWITSSPVVVNNRVYFGSRDSKIYCINAQDGSYIWSFTTGRAISSSPAIVNGRLYIGSKDDKLYCLNAENGDLLWSESLGETVDSSPAIVNDKVYVCSTNFDPSDASYFGMIYCLNALNGEHVWSKKIGYTTSSPAVYNDRVFICSYDWKIYCFDANNGNLIWDYTTDGKITFSSPAIAEGKIYLGSDLNLYCLDINNGGYLWSYTTGWSIYSCPTIAGDKVYVGSEDGYIYCFSDPPSSPPNKPSISGPKSGKCGVNYEYILTTTDPEGDDIYYLVDWGDNIREEFGPYNTGESITVNHTWNNKGVYIIKASAKDVHNAEGYITTYEVSMAKDKAKITNSPFFNFLKDHPLLYLIYRQIIQLLKL